MKCLRSNLNMKIIDTTIPELKVIEPSVFLDDRGSFYESFNAKKFSSLTGFSDQFVQDNHSKSSNNVLRGLHYQIKQSQGKLVRVTSGSIFDVAVDLRRSSPTFGQWIGIELSEENKRQLWIPVGFAHGFVVIGDSAEILYKTTDYWSPEHERTILWSDPTLAIDWPLTGIPVLSEKDRLGKLLHEAEIFN